MEPTIDKTLLSDDSVNSEFYHICRPYQIEYNNNLNFGNCRPQIHTSGSVPSLHDTRQQICLEMGPVLI